MPAGSLRQRLRFERRPVAADDGYGNVEGAWRTAFEAMARVTPLRGSETVIAQRLAGVQPLVITTYSCENSRAVAPGWRAVDQRSGDIYNIRSGANFDEKNRMLTFMADAGVPT